MAYPYTRQQIHDFVQAPKVVRANTRLEVSKRGEIGAAFDVSLDLIEGSFIDLRYLGKAAATDQTPTYESSLILAGHRVRGVGHNFVGRTNLRAKQRIPAGWHQNKVDPNLPTMHVEYNRHEPLPRFAPTDFGDFVGSAPNSGRLTSRPRRCCCDHRNDHAFSHCPARPSRSLLAGLA